MGRFGIGVRVRRPHPATLGGAASTHHTSNTANPLWKASRLCLTLGWIGCGGSCDLRTITLMTGDQLVLEETFVGGVCPSGSCHHGPVEGGGTGTLTDVVIDENGVFFGASGTLTGTVRGATSNVRHTGGSSVKLSGTLAYS